MFRVEISEELDVIVLFVPTVIVHTVLIKSSARRTEFDNCYYLSTTTYRACHRYVRSYYSLSYIVSSVSQVYLLYRSAREDLMLRST